MDDETKGIVIVAALVAALLAGAQGCQILTNRQCEQTRRTALISGTEPARTLVLSKGCQ